MGHLTDIPIFYIILGFGSLHWAWFLYFAFPYICSSYLFLILAAICFYQTAETVLYVIEVGHRRTVYI